MKINYILAILGFIFGILGAIVAYGLSGINSELITNGSIALISGILGLIGIWLFDKDYRISSVQYIISGIGILIGVSLFGVLGFIFYVVAAIVSFVEKDKARPTPVVNNNNTHYYGNTPQPPVTQKNSDMQLWLIPIISFIIIIFVAVGGSFSHDAEIAQKTTSLEVSNITIKSNGYSMYTVSCDLTPKMDYDYLQMQVIFYDSNGAVIGKSPLVWNTNNPAKDQLIKVSGIAMTSNSNTVPARAELYFYDSALTSDSNDAIFVKNVTITK